MVGAEEAVSDEPDAPAVVLPEPAQAVRPATSRPADRTANALLMVVRMGEFFFLIRVAAGLWSRGSGSSSR